MMQLASTVPARPRKPRRLKHTRPTDRELQVAELIAAGKGDIQIADELGLSQNTVRAHAQNLYRRLDVHSRTQLIQKLASTGDLVLGGDKVRVVREPVEQLEKCTQALGAVVARNIALVGLVEAIVPHLTPEGLRVYGAALAEGREG